MLANKASHQTTKQHTERTGLQIAASHLTSPTRAFSRLLLPTLGLPTMATAAGMRTQHCSGMRKNSTT